MQRRMNITLTAIVVCFFLLVFPSELLMFIIEISEDKHDADVISVTTVVCNLLQALNMSINVILYYVVNSQFRKSLKDMFGAYECTAARKVFHQLTLPASAGCQAPKCNV